jgi:uroporphyrinogen III methyltransferase / synthase
MPATAKREKRTDRTILISSRLSEIEAVLRERGFSVVTWPELAIQPPQTFAPLDEAIENLFGYDWLIFVNEDAARFFLERFDKAAHEVSELDSLRVCAIGDTTAVSLEKARVHVDVIATNVTSSSAVEQIADYVGGHKHLQRLNFLIPQASIGREYLKPELEKADARADVIVAYQTVAAKDATRLSVLHSLLLTASVDAVVFANESDVSDFSRLFDTHDLGQLLKNVAVGLADQSAAVIAAQMGVVLPVLLRSSSPDEMVDALITRF